MAEVSLGQLEQVADQVVALLEAVAGELGTSATIVGLGAVAIVAVLVMI